MKQEFYIGKEGIVSEEGLAWDLLYYIVLKEGAYSIKVDRVGEDGTLTDETAGLTDSYNEAEALVKRLMKGSVTPVCLDQVVDRIM